jgi:glyoxylase-like metal-dependent hydrolase (beta-lactamase superfamily II)
MKISDHCYVVAGLSYSDLFPVNAGFIISDSETVFIDSGYTIDSAQTIYSYAHTVNPANTISTAILLEEHFDHIFSAGYSTDHSVAIWSHETVELQQERIDKWIQDSNKSIKIKTRKNNMEAMAVRD